MYVQIISDLQIQSAPSTTQEYLVGGYHAVDDGGGGHFIWIATTSPLTEDGGIIIWPTFSGLIGQGYYKRLSHTPYVSVKWFGAYGDGVADDTVAIQAALGSVTNYISQTNMVSGWFQNTPPADGSSSTVFFPAGIYIIKKTLNVYGYYKNIKGERAILKKNDNVLFIGTWAMDMTHGYYSTIEGLTFTGFKNGLNIDDPGNINSSNVRLEQINFSDISETALRVNCQSAYVEMKNCAWRSVRLAMDLVASDKCIVDGGWIDLKPWDAHGQHAISSRVELVMTNMCCVPPFVNDYSSTASWIHYHSYGLTIDSVRFGGEGGGITVVNGYGQGATWSLPASDSVYAAVIKIKNSSCFCAGPAVRLFAIPNGVVLEDNIGFAWDGPPLIEYDDSINTLDSQLATMKGLFSIKMDNVPFPRLSNQWGNLEHPSIFGDQSKLLPYVRLNNGLDSYGHIIGPIGITIPGPFPISYYYYGPQAVVFFGGKLSNEAIRGGYSYEIKLQNVVAGQVTEYSEYRIETSESSGNFYISNMVDLTGNANLGAPFLTLDPTTNIVSAGINGNTPGNGAAMQIFYEIRCLVPTVSIPI
jgi:hypothetical protein